MTFRQRQLLGWGIMATAALLGGAWLWHLDFSRKISTDVLDLIPANERAPELTLVRSLASDAESRTMFIVLSDAAHGAVSAAASARFVETLARDPAFDQVLSLNDPAVRDALGAELFAQRFRLLFPLWLADAQQRYSATGGPSEQFNSWLARDAVARLTAFLATPEALAFQELVPADPLLLMAGAVDRLKGGLALVQPAAAAGGPALIWARLSASPLSEAGQAPAFAAVARAGDAARAVQGGLTVTYSGVNRFAAASRAQIEREVKWLNVLSLVAVLAVAFTFIRSALRGLHLVPVVLLSTLGAWVCATAAFERLHIMVFVVGSLLTGVAIDYGFYLFMQPPAFPDEDYWAKVRRLAKPLLASCLTTVAGFALLLFSELPFIRQLGVFVGTGLLSALAAAVIYFSTVRTPFLEARVFRARRAPANSPRPRGTVRLVLGTLWLLALPGLFRLTWKDDIRELQIPSPALTAEHERITNQFGESGNQTVYLSYGASLTEARAALAKFETWLQTAGHGKVATVGLGAIVPTAEQQAASVRFVHAGATFPGDLRTALTGADYDGAAFDPFFAAYDHYAATAAESDIETALRALQPKLVGPVGLLLHVGQPLSWFVTLAREGPGSPPAETSTITASQLQSLNRIFGRYRQSALWLSLIGLGIVGGGVFLTYGWRDGVRIFAIPCGTCLGLFGVLGWFGLPLNLFHLLGAFLGVCLTHNYSIFTATSAYRREATPVSVRTSALTTAASFGVLALSGIPVVRALGSTVALMVVLALLAIEAETLATLGRRR